MVKPLVRVATVLGPLAWTPHIVSLWRLVGGYWAPIGPSPESATGRRS